MRQIPKSFLALMLGVTLVTAFLQILNFYFIDGLLSYHRESFWDNIIYQWITPNLVHLNWQHWFLNILNFYASIILFYSAWSIKTFIKFFLLASIFVILMLHFFTLHINTYVGMSGVLYGVALYGAIQTYPNQKYISGFVISYIIIKLLAEDTISYIMGVDIILDNIYVVSSVHWYGVVFVILFMAHTNIRGLST
ncbi:MAG: rhombosortase [Sulfurovum sp.]